MTLLQKEDFSLHYTIDGAPDAPVLVLSNSLGTDLSMWVPQMAALASQFRVLRYDTRGHGQSGVTPGPYSVAQLGQDVIALLDHLGIASAHFCGLSMGGMTGMWLAIHHPQRIKRLVLANTAALIGTAEAWNSRIATVNANGMAAIIPGVLERWFTAGFRERDPDAVAAIVAGLLRTSPEGYGANCGAVRDMDQRVEVAAIRAPTLVIAGTHDLATPPASGKLVADHIAGAAYLELNAAHLSNIEQPAAFTDAVLTFLNQGN
jgi:3-oxoadipate enol-lactonase